jgi:putative NADH-flavin reductase
MKLGVFGSTGGTGRLILTEALRRGHEVTAFARNADALAGIQGLAGVVEGDGRYGDAVAAAVAGQGAVIMTVSGRGEPDVATGIARAVTAAMATAGVARLVATSSYAMVATRPYVLAPLVRKIFGKALIDQRSADEVIRATGLDWTILRASRLTAAPATRPPRVSTGLFVSGPYSVSRAAYANVLLDYAEAPVHVGETVNVTG